MADIPDPTRRLRPLLDARARRTASDEPSRDGHGVGRAVPQPTVAGAADVRPATATTDEPAVGWIPVWPVDAAGFRHPAGQVPRRSAPPVGRHRDAVTARRGGGNARYDDSPEEDREERGRDERDLGQRRHRRDGDDDRNRVVRDRDDEPDRDERDRDERDRDDSDDRVRDRHGRHDEQVRGRSIDRGSIHDDDDDDDDDDDRDDRDSAVADAWSGRRPGWFSGRRPWARWRERWVPEGPGVRVDPGRRGSALLSVIAIGAVVAAALGMFGSGGTAVGPSTVAVVEGQTSAVVASSTAARPSTSTAVSEVPTSGGSGTTSAAAPTELVVSVTGAVVRPGIVTLSPGARVADAIAAAGGVLDGTDYTGINLAARVADGDSVVVGGAGQGVRSGGPSAGTVDGPSTGGAGGLVDLNGADQSELETLPGVGPVMAGNIVAWREANGGFTAVDQLQEISGIGPTRFATLAPLVRVG